MPPKRPSRKAKTTSKVVKPSNVSKKTKKAVSSKVTKHAAVKADGRHRKTKPALNPTPTCKSQPLDIFVWGTGSMCELGLGPAAKTKEVKRPRLNPFLSKENVGVVDIAVGGMHTLVLDKNNKVWSWGANDSFVLGRDTAGKEKLKEIAETKDDEDDDDDGDLNEAESTPGLVENLPTDVENNKVIQLAATDNLSAVLYENGDVYAWGTFRCNEGLLGFSADTKFQKTPKKMELKNIVQLAPGKDHILALDAYGKVFGWGDGQQYQLGRKVMERTRLQNLKPMPVTLKNIKYIASGDYHAFAIDHKGEVYTWGLNQYGQCGIKEDLVDGDTVTKPTKVTRLSDKNIVEIACGEHHTLALSNDGSLYAFGRYDSFEVGIGKDDLPEYSFKDDHGKVRAVPFPTLLTKVPKFRSVATGSHHCLGITEDGAVYSWGYGDTYAVGQGPDGDDIEVPTRIKNTATQDHDILVIGCGGQFSVSGGIKLSDEETEKREDKIEDFEENRNA
ncbi:Ran guanyl-nucleotide exchange factor [Saccharomycopsis crataegensis]|uniref:Ran guanyl-nucleotide exchange factor n=1 Tax=Saccharomycopsis crataegensis TaxID=43959 RepID=A0AAV5QHE8_9ASCO|nr:Ran guanyl-nucleotide exchange factor [Saccharomycopsis crataegensis]